MVMMIKILLPDYVIWRFWYTENTPGAATAVQCGALEAQVSPGFSTFHTARFPQNQQFPYLFFFVCQTVLHVSIVAII